jgi:hypothetical protein
MDIGYIAGAPIDIECGSVPAAIRATTIGDQSVAVRPDIPAAVQIRPLWRPLGLCRLSADCGGEQQRRGRPEYGFHRPLLLMSVICNDGSNVSVPGETHLLVSNVDAG